jgi:hypothetical protein
MVELARRKRLFSAEALWVFYLPKFDVLRQLLEAKAIGNVKSVYTDDGEYFARDHRIFDPKRSAPRLGNLPCFTHNWRRLGSNLRKLNRPFFVPALGGSEGQAKRLQGILWPRGRGAPFSQRSKESL